MNCGGLFRFSLDRWFLRPVGEREVVAPWSPSSLARAGKPPLLPPNSQMTPPKENHSDTSDVKERLRGVENKVYEQGSKLSEYGAGI